jgi:hypothetical protein
VPGSSCTKKKERLWFESPPSPPICTIGGPQSRGSGGSRLMRPMTSTSAAFMSVPIANVRKYVRCRRSWRCRDLLHAGQALQHLLLRLEQLASTSSGEAPRQLVKIEIVGARCRENSCKGSCFRLSRPNREISTNRGADRDGIADGSCNDAHLSFSLEINLPRLDHRAHSTFGRLRPSEGPLR